MKEVSTPYGYTAGVQYHPPTDRAGGSATYAGNRVRALTNYYHRFIENVTGPPYVTDVEIDSDPGR